MSSGPATIFLKGIPLTKNSTRFHFDVLRAALEKYYPHSGRIWVYEKSDFLLIEWWNWDTEAHATSMLFFHQIEALLESDPDLKSKQILWKMRS